MSTPSSKRTSARKLDLKKELGVLYRCPSQKLVEVNVPAAHFLMADGKGDPNTNPHYAKAVEALFTLAYTLKFSIKKSRAVDYAVMPLEGLWWSDDMSTFTPANKADWKWTLLIRQPEFVEASIVETVRAELRKKKPMAAVDLVRFERFEEGVCVQTLHVGPFSEEGPAVEKLHEHIRASGKQLSGRHHEIYLSDIRKAAPAKWRTIIRQPFM
jgi:hypothetical protein